MPKPHKSVTGRELPVSLTELEPLNSPPLCFSEDLEKGSDEISSTEITHFWEEKDKTIVTMKADAQEGVTGYDSNNTISNKISSNPIYTAIEKGETERVKVLLQEKATIEIPLDKSDNIFHVAAELGQVEILKLLLDYDETFTRENINAKNYYKDTPLTKAIAYGHAECVKMLLQKGASIEATVDEEHNVIHVAAINGQADILKLLLDYDETFTRENINAKNRYKDTPLTKAIAYGHTDCVKILLQKGASIEVTVDEEHNVFHVAVINEQNEILNLLLDYDETLTKKMINATNVSEVTTITKNIEKDHIECVKTLIQKGSLLEITTSSCKCKTIRFGSKQRGRRVSLLKVLLEHDETFTGTEINSRTVCKGYAPIHYAFEKNDAKSVDLLISKNASISIKTSNYSTLLHIAAKNNNMDFANLILDKNSSLLDDTDESGWLPLHTACYFGSKEVARLLIIAGTDLTACTKDGITTIEMMMNYLSKPTEFLESIFDSNIHTVSHNEVLKPGVIVDYSILVPENKNKISNSKMKVIEAILDTGDRSDQRRLLIHPVVESFMCLQWKAVVPFFCAMLLINTLFVLTLTIFVMTHYGYKDSKMEKPFVWDTTFWTYALYTTIAIVLLQEAIFLSLNFKHYLVQTETLVKLAFTTLAMILPKLIENTSPSSDTVDWARHVATTAILLSWLYTIVLLSRFPDLGCYVLMFRKVFSNMVKILLTFASLIVGFTLSFMIQLHGQGSFESFWAAFIKTMVMMTSEFDYGDLVTGKDAEASCMIRVFFLIFLLLAPLVLMNMTFGVAVDDINELKECGRKMQLEMQVEIINNLSGLLEIVRKKNVPLFWMTKTARILFRWSFFECLNDVWVILRYREPKCSYISKAIPVPIREACFKIAIEQGKIGEKSTNEPTELAMGFESLSKQLDDLQIKFENQKKQLDDLKFASGHQKKQMDDIQIGVGHQKKQLDDIQINFGHQNKQFNNIQISFGHQKKQLDDLQNGFVNQKKQIDDLSAKIDLLIKMKDRESQNTRSTNTW